MKFETEEEEGRVRGYLLRVIGEEEEEEESKVEGRRRRGEALNSKHEIRNGRGRGKS